MSEVATSNRQNMSVGTGLKILWSKVTNLEKELAQLRGEDISVIQNRVSEKEAHIKEEKAKQHMELRVEHKALEQQTKNSIIQMKRVIETQESRIKNIEKQFTSLSQEFVNLNNDDKYLKLNNFLVELQTTQMVMNDKV